MFNQVRAAAISIKPKKWDKAGNADKLELFFSPNPPKDTDGRREESGRGVRGLQGK